MPHVLIKLKKTNAPTSNERFNEPPSWEDLSKRINELFEIPQDCVKVSFLDDANEVEYIADQEELQRFYESLDPYDKPIKFVVQDTNAPETVMTIASTWSMGSNLSDLSQSADEFMLICWVLNMSDDPFSINIGKDKSVDDLKEAIKKKKEHTFSQIDYDALKLWKLSPSIPTSEVSEQLGHLQSPEKITGSIKLDPFKGLSTYFLSPPPSKVHIIVQLPLGCLESIHKTSRKRHRSDESKFVGILDTTEDTEVHQFRLLCERYWGRGDEGRAEIYKVLTVQVPFMVGPGAEGAEEAATTSDGMVVDTESEAEEAAIISEGMVVETADAQGAILMASNTTPTFSCDASEESNAGLDEELDLDFDNEMANGTVSYESLSLGPDFSNFFGDGYSSILVRKEYRDMFQHISNLRDTGKRGVVVTGMPGIGKSIFLFFVLIERILNGQYTAYQYDPARVILMLDRYDVRFIPSTVHLDPRGFPGTWALVDSNVELVLPHGTFTNVYSKFYLVQAASPQPDRWKGWKKYLSGTMAVMKPWSWEELYIGGTEFIFPPFEASTLHDIFVKYGGSARHCYTLARGDVTDWEKQIPDILARIPDIAILQAHIAGGPICHTSESAINASSELITIIPNSIRHPRVTLVSRHIAEHFFKAALVKDSQMFWNYFNQFSSVPETRTPAGWLWKLYAIPVVFSTRTKTMSVSLYRLPPGESSQPPTPIELPFSDVIVHGDQKALGEELSRVIPSLSQTKSALFIPGVKNTFDAFSISGDNLITLYQATIQESHSVKAKGLDFVWDALTLAESHGMSDAKKLLPSTRKWRVVFLIPEEAEKHWKTAQSIDFWGIKPRRQWGNYVEQFVGVLQKGTMASYLYRGC